MILIKNGYLIDPESSREGEYDLLVEESCIKEIQKRGGFSNVQVKQTIDAKDCWVVPGLIDLHVHLREPGFEWKETVRSGCEAAVLGGYTAVCCMPNTSPTNDCAEVTKYILEKTKQAGLARVFPIGAVSQGLKGKQMGPFSEMKEAGCVAFSDDGEPVYDAALMRRALEWCLMLGVPIACHEEDKSLSACGCMNESALSTRLGLKGWPKVAEEVMIARDIELARVTGGKIHICHVSTARGVELIRRAKKDGILVSAEVTPHHLLLTEERIGEYDTSAKMSPPLRNSEDNEALIAGLQDGTIDCVASDHAPHETDSKNVEFSKATFGILGLQTTLPLMLEFVRTKKITAKRLVQVLSSEPSRIFNLGVGKLDKGSLADVTIINPEYSWRFRKDVVRSLSFNSPFMGRDMHGIAETVLVSGKVVVEGQKLV